MKNEKLIGLLILFIIYLLASVAGAFSFIYFEKINITYLLSIFLADVVATVVVYLGGVIFKTASVYDPYWSVQTFIIYVLLLFKFNNWNWGTILYLIPLAIYTVRLTGNFIYTFDSLKYIDWRYRMLKEKTKYFYQVVNLLGICLFPTCVVYLASVPMFVFAEDGQFNPLQFIGFVLMIGAILLEFIADKQMHYFRKHRKDKNEIINVGLWKYSRHPNYLGEISFWFMMYVFFIVSYPSQWYWIIGAIVNLLLFLFISIPMEEKHMMSYKPNLKIYQKTTSMLLLLPPKKEQNISSLEENN